MKFEGCVGLGSMSLLPDSRGGEEEVEEDEVEVKKKKKTEQKQEVFRAVARTPKKFRRVGLRPLCAHQPETGDNSFAQYKG